MLNNIQNFVKGFKVPDITVDLTGGNTMIYQQGDKENPIKVNEPAILVIDGESCRAFGREAENITGLCPDGVKVVYPVQKGVIAEPDYCEQLLKHYFSNIFKKKLNYCLYPNVVAVIPQDSTPSHQKIMTETIDSAGAKGISLVKSLRAAAHGIGFNKENSGASIVMNITKDYSEIGIISLSKIHYSTTLSIGYDDFKKGIIEYVRLHSEYTIGMNNAKKALDSLGTATYEPDMDDAEKINITGLLKRTSVPEDIKLTKLQVFTAIRPLVDRLIGGLLEVLEKAREDMAEDLRNNGVTIVGIGGRIARLDKAITDAINIKAKTVKNYETCIVEGAGMIQGGANR